MLIQDTFNRPDTSTSEGLGFVSTPKNGFQWENISGLWRILNQNAHSSSSANDSPIAAIETTGADFVVIAQIGGGGDAVYARIKNATNWIRLRFRMFSVTTSVYTTEYEWKCVYREGTESDTDYLWYLDLEPTDARFYLTVKTSDLVGGHGHTQTIIDKYKNDTLKDHKVHQWQETNTAPTTQSDRYGHSHDVALTNGGVLKDEHHNHPPTGSWYYSGQTMTTGGYTYTTTYKWHTSKTSSPCGSTAYSSEWTGRTRQVLTGTSVSYRYFLYLESSLNGTVSVLDSQEISVVPRTLQFEGKGNNLRAGHDGTFLSTMSKTSSVHNDATKHGIGKGQSEITTTKLAYAQINTLDSETFHERWGEVLI